MEDTGGLGTVLAGKEGIVWRCGVKNIYPGNEHDVHENAIHGKMGIIYFPLRSVMLH